MSSMPQIGDGSKVLAESSMKLMPLSYDKYGSWSQLLVSIV